MTAPAITITHRPERQTFEAMVEGQRCVADYRRQGQVVHLHHTYVPSALGGRGIAAQLVEAALSWIRSEGLRLAPDCSYVAVYVRRHAQWQDLLA